MLVDQIREVADAEGAVLTWGGVPLLNMGDISFAISDRRRARDQRIEEIYRSSGRWFKGSKDHFVFEKSEVVKGDGTPYTVFTPYSRRWRERLALEGLPSHPSREQLPQGLRQHLMAPEIPTLAGMNFSDPGIEIPPVRWAEEIGRAHV